MRRLKDKAQNTKEAYWSYYRPYESRWYLNRRYLNRRIYLHEMLGLNAAYKLRKSTSENL